MGASMDGLGGNCSDDQVLLTAGRPSTRRMAVISVGVCVAAAAAISAPTTVARGSTFSTPIQHVVLILQENHSFDNVLGALCVQSSRCDGATMGKLYAGQPIPLSQATDHVAQVVHTNTVQITAIDSGKMDGFSLISGCMATKYACYSQYWPSQIPNAAALATNFVISDRTFKDDSVQSWGMHLESVSATLDGFVGGEPGKGKSGILGPGWGCNSGLDAGWVAPNGALMHVPACVPKPNGTGPYRSSPVTWVPTIMDRLDAAALSWKLYVGLPIGTATGNNNGYGWAICPTFADCIYGPHSQNMVASSQVIGDAHTGNLPNFSVVTPT